MFWNRRWNKLYERAVRNGSLRPDSSECDILMLWESRIKRGEWVPPLARRCYGQVKRLGDLAAARKKCVMGLPWYRRMFA